MSELEGVILRPHADAVFGSRQLAADKAPPEEEAKQPKGCSPAQLLVRKDKIPAPAKAMASTNTVNQSMVSAV